jgi:hypothetical protein
MLHCYRNRKRVLEVPHLRDESPLEIDFSIIFLENDIPLQQILILPRDIIVLECLLILTFDAWRPW